MVTVVRDNRTWKVLTLPPPSISGEETDWIELVDSTVERAWDRWCYAQQHAVRAARERFRAQVAVAVAGAAWSNYWDLLQESELIKERLSARRGRLGGGTFSARRQ
jgi:predicted RNA-binding protein with PIN domain